jgi:hypothetical protein
MPQDSKLDDGTIILFDNRGISGFLILDSHGFRWHIPTMHILTT